MEPARASRKHRWARRAGLGFLSMMLLATAIVTWLINDTERVRHEVENFISEVSKRPFSIEGEFDYDLGRTITVRASKIRWGNAPDSRSPYMLEVEQLTGSVNLLSLFERPVVITAAHVTNATLLFEWVRGRSFNWRLLHPEKVVPKRTAPRSPLPLVIDHASVDNVSLLFRHPALTGEIEIFVLSAQTERDGLDRLEVSAMALLEDQKLAIEGRVGPFPQLAVAGAVNFDLAVEGPLAKLSTAGDFSWLARLRDPDLVLELSGPSADALANRLKLPIETVGAVQLNAKVATHADVVAATARGAFGEYEIDAEFRTNSLISLQGLDATLRSRGPSIRDVAAFAALTHLPDKPFELEARALQTNQGIELKHFRLETSGLNIDAAGKVGAIPDLRDIDLRISAAGSDFSAVAQLFKRDIAVGLPFQLNARVTDSGPGNDDVDATLKLGKAIARVMGSICGAGDFSGSAFQVAVDTPDANELAKAVGISAPAGAPLKARMASSITAERINFETLRVSVADAELVGSAWLDHKSDQRMLGFQGKAKGTDLARIIGPLLPAGARPALTRLPFTASAELRLTPGILDIKAFNAGVGESELNFSGRLAAGKRGAGLSGALSARTESLAELLKGLGTGDIPDQVVILKSRLQATPGEIRFHQLSLTGEHAKIGGSLAFTGQGYSRIEFDLTASGESLTRLIPKNDVYRPADVPLRLAARGSTSHAKTSIQQFQARLGDASVEFSGELQFRPTMAVSGIRLQGSGPRLSDLGEISGIRLTPRPFIVSASVQGDASEQRVDDLEFESGENNLRGRLRFVHNTVPTMEIAITSSRLNLDEIRVADMPADGSTTTSSGGGRVFSDEPLPFEMLDKVDGNASIQIDDLVSGVRRWHNLSIELSLDRGKLQIRQAQVDAANGTLSIRGEVKPAPAGRAVHLDISAANAMIVLNDMSQEEVDRLPRLAVAGQLSATGSTPHELAASLDGFVWLVGGEGRTRRTKLSPLVGDFLTELFDRINPFAESVPYTAVDCLGIYLEVANGKTETSPAIVIRTDRAVTLAEGKLDLATEKIDVTFETTPRKGIGVSANALINPFAKLGGTLGTPELTLNPKGTVVEGGIAVVTLGLSLLAKSLWKSWFENPEICKEIAKKAVELRKARDPDAVPSLDELKAGSRGSKTE